MSEEQTRERRQSILTNPFVWAFFIGIVTLTLIRPLLRREPAPPPVVGQLPAYSLVAADGTSFGSADLAGQVYIADFIFTRCVSICPLLTARMKQLQERLDAAGVEGIRLVSISVDPEYDTPERLQEYAAGVGADASRWFFLTGPPDDVRRLIVEGFKTGLGDPVSGPETPLDIAHSGRFVLVDGDGGLRGYYESTPLGLDEVFHRAQHVLKQQRGG